jgi:predicted transcriptional regulator
MEPRDAVLTVVRAASEPLHWTVIQDTALRRGYLDPFEIADVRRAVLAALAELVRDGLVSKTGTGTYVAANDHGR